jgi:hypothetical protein
MSKMVRWIMMPGEIAKAKAWRDSAANQRLVTPPRGLAA